MWLLLPEKKIDIGPPTREGGRCKREAIVAHGHAEPLQGKGSLRQSGKLGSGQNLEEHVERSEKHLPRPEQVENTGGGMLLHMDHVLAVDGSRLEKVVWQLPAVSLRHSLRFDFCLSSRFLDYWQICRYYLLKVSGTNQPARGLRHKPPEP